VLDELDEFIAACVANAALFPSYMFEAGDIYCPGCSGPRRLRLRPASSSRIPIPSLHRPKEAFRPGLDLSDRSTDAIAKQLAPAVITGKCLQDDTMFTFVIFEGPTGFELAVFPNRRGGLSTSNTPQNVAYYLDQAQRSQSSGAVTAAIAMYRSALESILFEQGFAVRMLGPKIAALEAQINAGSAPRWARDLDSDFLRVLKDLGNAAVHFDGRDVQRQDREFRGLLTEVTITFSELLEAIYEREHKEMARLAALQAAHASIASP
jgi:Domain of unknown function (DUF4145)